MAGKIKLTDRALNEATLKPGQRDRLIFDRDLPGFGVRIQANGRKFFLVQYCMLGVRRRMPLGAYGVLTVAEARKRALAALGDVARRIDPLAEQRAALAAQRAAEAKAKGQAVADEFTFRRLVDQWEAAREGACRASYLAVAGAAMRRHLADWLTRPAASITKAEARRALDKIADAGSPVAANRVLAYSRAAYGWGVRKDLVPANPFTGIEPPAAEKSRDRVLDADELASIWRAAGTLTIPNGAFVRVLMLTAQRRDEVAKMAWAELSPDLTTWTLPRERAKNDKAHVVHLAEPVRDIIAALPRIKDCPFVFATAGARPVSAHGAIKTALDAAVTAERGAALPAWTFHDFRRAAVTALAGMGFAPHVCDRLLNHVGGAIKGVAAVYQRAEFLAERRAALDAWAAHVVRAAEGTTDAGNVIALRATG